MDMTIMERQSPIEYKDVRIDYNTVRGIMGLVMTLVGIRAISVTGIDSLADIDSLTLTTAGIVITGAAILERLRGTTALTPLLVDSTAVGLISVIRGHSAGIEGAAFVYIVTGALLLLPPRLARWVILYAAVWAAPIALIDPISEISYSAALEVGAVLGFAAVVAQLLLATSRALSNSDRRHREALESERRAVDLKDEFVSMVSHELRTPLTSISGFAETLRDNWAILPSDEVDEFLGIMRGEASHLSSLVEDILVIPRLEAGRLRLEPEEISLRTETMAVAKLVMDGSAIDCQVDIPTDIRVVADPQRLRQVLRNLLENARKYGGDQTLVTGTSEENIYTVVVADNGPGIAIEDRERIFEHFEQGHKGDARSEGVGLGLPIALKLVKAMGGDLWFRPRFPTGSQFLFTIALHVPDDEAFGLESQSSQRDLAQNDTLP